MTLDEQLAQIRDNPQLQLAYRYILGLTQQAELQRPRYDDNDEIITEDDSNDA